MNTLFDISPNFPPGFSYTPAFITKDEEAQLIAEIRQTELHIFQFQGYEAKRRVASFGHDWNFETRTLSKGSPAPATFQPIINKVATHLSIPLEQIAELLLTEYPPGSVINWHRDAPAFDLIAGISLGSDCTFKLRPQDKALQSRQSIISFPVQRRSLYLMRDEARTDWQHSISPVKDTRFSITLRTLRAASPSLLPKDRGKPWHRNFRQ